MEKHHGLCLLLAAVASSVAFAGGSAEVLGL